MSEDRARVLQMVNEGKITAEEGARLLAAMRAPQEARPYPQRESPTGKPTWFHVRVTNLETGRAKVNVNLPLGLVKAGVKIGAHFKPDISEVDWDEVLAAIEEGASGKLVEVEDEDGGERVEVFVE